MHVKIPMYIPLLGPKNLKVDTYVLYILLL